MMALRLTTFYGDSDSAVYRHAMRHQETVTVRVEVPTGDAMTWEGVPVLVDYPTSEEGRLEEWEITARG